MKVKPFILSLAVLTALTFSACDNGGESSQPAETTGSTLAVTDSSEIITTTNKNNTAEILEYNGTFNEDVFNQIAQNIKIDDARILFPCTTKELPSNISIGGEPIIIEESKVVNYQLCYNETDLGSCSFSYIEDPEDYDNLSMTGVALNRDEHLLKLISVGEITFQHKKQQVIDQLGEPTKRTEFSSGNERFDYYVKEHKYITFMFYKDERMSSIGIFDESR